MIKTAQNRYILSNLPFFSWISTFIRSKWFVFCLAVFCALSNAFGYDYYFYIAVASIAIYISVFGKDYLPYIPLMIFSYIAPSIKNNPSKSGNSIFLLENGGKTLIIMGCAVALFLIIRLIFDREIGFKKAVTTKYKLLGGMLFLGISYLTSGLGSATLEGFETKNLIFAGMQFLAMVVPYLIISFGVKWNKVVKDYLAFTVLCFGLVVGAQIVFAYFTNGVMVNGKPNNVYIFSGWGVSTNMGAMVTLAIPFAFYYLAKDKNAFLSNVIILFLFFANALSLSRNSILVGGFLYVVCQIITFSKSKKISTKIITALFIILLLTGVYLFNHYVFNMLGFSFANGLNSNGRDELYKHAIETFYSYPLLGGGFYGINSTLHPSEVGWNSFFPRMWHNNILQVLATGGIVCFIAYLIHRINTLKLVMKNPTIENAFIALSLLALLLMSLLDCYFFQLGPMLLYSSALAFIEHRKPHVKEEPFERVIFKRRRERLKIKNNKD